MLGNQLRNISEKFNLDFVIPYLWLMISLTSVSLLQQGLPGLQSEDVVSGNKFNQFIYGGLMLGGVFVLRERKTRIKEILLSNIPLILLLSYSFLSIFWSHYPVVAFRRIILFLGGIEMVLLIASAPDHFRNFSRIFFWFLLTTTFVSIFMVLFNPSIGVMYDLGGAWRGVTLHKNIFGQLMGVASLFWIFQATTNVEKKRFMSILLLAISFFLLLKSKSATAFFTALSVMFLYLLLYTLRHRLRVAVGVCVSLIVLGVCFLPILEYFFWDKPIIEVLFSSAGKDLTFTDRTYLWSILIESISKHPILGTGFGSFWLEVIPKIHDDIKRLRIIMAKAI